MDIDFINQLGRWQIPFSIAFTKADKSTQKEVAANVSKFLSDLSKSWEELPPYFVTSAEKRTGIKQILQFIDDHNILFEKYKKGSP
jgi:GTP-binding protein